MALTVQEMIQRYKEDPAKSRELFVFILECLKSAYDPIHDEKDLLSAKEKDQYKELIGSAGMLSNDDELTDEELEYNFGAIANNIGILDKNVDGKTLREKMTEHPVFSKTLEKKLKDADETLGTGFSEAGVYRPNRETGEDVERISASSEIRRIQKLGLPRNPDARWNSNIENATAIMAARALSGCKRNDLATLDKAQITKAELDKESSALSENPVYQSFLNKVKNDPDLKAQWEDAITSGHGGKLDEMFTNFIAYSAPGEMPSDPALQRWMPTAAQRIEALQTMATYKSTGDVTMNGMFEDPGIREDEMKKWDTSKAAAEILLVRNQVKAERNKKSTLNRQIKVDAGLKDKVNQVGKDKGFRKLMANAKIREQLVKGHGGKMIDKMLKAQDKVELSEDTKAALEGNTLKARARTLRNSAATIQDYLKNRETDPRVDEQDAIQEARNVATEYFVLKEAAGTKPMDPPSKFTEDMKKTVPWNKVDKQVGKEDSPLNIMNKRSALDSMGNLSYQPFERFFEIGQGEEPKTKMERMIEKNTIEYNPQQEFILKD